VVAKMVVLAVWIAILALLAVVLTAGIAVLLGAQGFAWSHVLKGLGDTLAVSGLIYLTLPFVAWLAMLGKGYLRPMLYSMALMMMTTALIDTPISRWLPWSLSVHLVGASWYPVPPADLTAGSVAVAVVFFLVGVAALMWRIDHADSAR
jgi:ABC-2 type transport system permease protein